MATDVEIALIVVASVLLLSLLCTCCCWRCQSDKKDAHVRTGAQRRAAMDAYWRTRGEDREPAGVKRTEGYVVRGLACLLCYSAVVCVVSSLGRRALLALITSVMSPYQHRHCAHATSPQLRHEFPRHGSVHATL